MGRIKRFEDIQAWQRARELTKELYSISSKGLFCKDLSLREQMRRAAISVMLNIAEGFARRTNKEFLHFLFVAHGSIAEIQSSLYIALDLGYINQEKFESLYNECEEISKMITGLIKHLKDK